jgi:hypothetical protein
MPYQRNKTVPQSMKCSSDQNTNMWVISTFCVGCPAHPSSNQNMGQLGALSEQGDIFNSNQAQHSLKCCVEMQLFLPSTVHSNCILKYVYSKLNDYEIR